MLAGRERIADVRPDHTFESRTSHRERPRSRSPGCSSHRSPLGRGTPPDRSSTSRSVDPTSPDTAIEFVFTVVASPHGWNEPEPELAADDGQRRGGTGGNRRGEREGRGIVSATRRLRCRGGSRCNGERRCDRSKTPPKTRLPNSTPSPLRADQSPCTWPRRPGKRRRIRSRVRPVTSLHDGSSCGSTVVFSSTMASVLGPMRIAR